MKRIALDLTVSDREKFRWRALWIECHLKLPQSAGQRGREKEGRGEKMNKEEGGDADGESYWEREKRAGMDEGFMLL